MISSLRLENLSVRRGGRLLFEGLNLALGAGEAAALTGRNGAGKTSLLRTISGLVQTEAGTITFGDLDPSTARAEGLHLIGHLDGLKPTRTARECITGAFKFCFPRFVAAKPLQKIGFSKNSDNHNNKKKKQEPPSLPRRRPPLGTIEAETRPVRSV